MDIITYEGTNKPQRTQKELRHGLEVANRRLIELKSRKKAAMKMFNEEIRDMETEIKSVIDQLKLMEDKHGQSEGEN